LVAVAGADEVVQTSTQMERRITAALLAAAAHMPITQQWQRVRQEVVGHHVKAAMVRQMVPVAAVVQEVPVYRALQVVPVELVCRVTSMKPE
jgi:hypothetical protein